MFKKGMKVKKILHDGGVTSEEFSTILKVSKNGKVWLDNDGGNDPSGAFIDGKKEGIFGFWEEIQIIE